MIAESLLGGIFGGLLRLAPEVFKFFDRKNEREHELKMLGAEMEFARVRGEIEMHKMEANMSIAELNAISESFKEQSATAVAGGWFVAALSALVRPLVTYWMMFLYSMHKIASMTYAYDQTANWQQVFMASWNEQDWTVLSMILSYWFISRSLEKRR